MKFKRVNSVLITSAIFSIAVTCAFSQTTRPDFNRAQTYDVQHYRIEVSFDRSRKEVIGDTTVSLKPLKEGLRVVELDAVDIAFRSVTLEPAGSVLEFKNSKRSVAVTLDRAYDPSDTISIRFIYTARPKKGVYFVKADGDRSAQIWTQGEPEEARHWFPSFDFPSDKATTEQIITAEKGESVIGNGQLLSKTDNPNGTVTWHYKMPVPHSTYLVSFVIGKYSLIQEKYRDIPLGYYMYPGKESTAKNAYDRTADMFAVFEKLIGIDYPFNKYDQTMVAEFQFGGMENITATTMADTEIFFAAVGYGKNAVMDLVSHELAHSWFGNMVTCRNWAELWLNEGFATFMEAVYREKLFGREDYQAKIRRDAATFLVDDSINRIRHGLFNQRAGDVSTLFDSPGTTYNKGSVVVHMLREQVGDQNFWKAVNIYLNRHRFGSVETTDLQRAMEEVSGQDLKWFFDQWVYGIGSPRLDIRKTYHSRTKELTLAVAQTQSAANLVPAAFRLPMEVEIMTAAGTRTEKIEITKRTESFSIKLDGPPKSITFDSNEKIPLKTVSDRRLRTIR